MVLAKTRLTAARPTFNALDYGVTGNGITDDTTALQGLLNTVPAGAVVTIPIGAICNLTGTVTIATRVCVIGGGTLNWTAGVTTATALIITAGGTILDGITLANPNQLQAQTGGKNVAVNIRAHDVNIRNCQFTTWQNGIMIDANGEWLGAIITGNHVTVIGAGGGASSASSLGEDRGDGIVCWGADAIITDNVVTAVAGTDARIGIHVENLNVYEVTPRPYSERIVTIGDNTVKGPFRRGIAAESVGNIAITGNNIADSTWWAIALIDSNSISVTSNTVHWTRTSADNHGSAWSPVRCPIMFYGANRGVTATGNALHFTATSVAAAAISLSTPGTGTDGAAITGTVMALETGALCPLGITGNKVTNSTFANNSLHVTAGGSTDSAISDYLGVGNTITGNTVVGTATGSGIRHEGAGLVAVSGNTATNFPVGVSVINCTDGCIVTGNNLATVTGVDTFGTSGLSMVTNNNFTSATVTGHVNVGSQMSSLRTRHLSATAPTGGRSGDLLAGSGKLWLNDAGSWATAVLVRGRTVTTAATIADSDQTIVFNSTAAISQALPAASAVTAFKRFNINNINTGVVTLTDTISGAANRTLSQWQSLTVFSTGTVWVTA